MGAMSRTLFPCGARTEEFCLPAQRGGSAPQTIQTPDIHHPDTGFPTEDIMNESYLFAQQSTFGTDVEALSGHGSLAEQSPQEWLVELIARSWLEPSLADRYRADAHSVLDEFGVTLAAGEQVPALPEAPECELSIEELSRPVLAHAGTCLTWSESAVPAAGQNPATVR
jgi:putative thiazole/oxazole-modified microcin (TOMM)-like peptide